MISEVFASLGQTSIQIISFLGYFGVFVLMVLESMIFPIPSELVMPFAGFLAAGGGMVLVFVILFSSLGSLAGSLLSYYLGRWGGNKLIFRYGKYFLLDELDLVKTEGWFKKRGEITIFVGRFIPVVRHLISIPAGIGRMNLRKFLLYTALGATIWNSFLAYLGFLLGKNWEIVKAYSDYITIPVVIILAVLACYFVFRFVNHKMKIKREARTTS